MFKVGILRARIAAATEELARSIREHKPFAILEYETYIAHLQRQLDEEMRASGLGTRKNDRAVYNEKKLDFNQQLSQAVGRFVRTNYEMGPDHMACHSTDYENGRVRISRSLGLYEEDCVSYVSFDDIDDFVNTWAPRKKTEQRGSEQ